MNHVKHTNRKDQTMTRRTIHYPKLDHDTYNRLSFPGMTMPPEAKMAACGAEITKRDNGLLPLSYSYPNCEDCAPHVPAMPREPYQRTIYRLDPTVNACGVEYHMRLQYGTLDHLSRQTFREEIALAKACEKAEPGHLRMCAESYGALAEFEECEALVKEPSRIIVPKPPQIIV